MIHFYGSWSQYFIGKSDSNFASHELQQFILHQCQSSIWIIGFFPTTLNTFRKEWMKSICRWNDRRIGDLYLPVYGDISLEWPLWIPDHALQWILKQMVLSMTIDLSPCEGNWVARGEIVDFDLGRSSVIWPKEVSIMRYVLYVLMIEASGIFHSEDPIL